MTIRAVHLRSQDKILSDIEILQRDTTNKRWTDVEIYYALNMALDTWHGRVLIPHLYTGISSWTAGTYDYSLPSYVAQARIRPQMEQTVVNYPSITYVDGTATTWVDILSYGIEPTAEGGFDLRLGVSSSSVDARVLYWVSNGQVPPVAVASQPALNAELSAAGTSLVLDSVVSDIGQSGFAKIGDEWMQWAGVSDDGTNTTLSNLARALDGTTAAVHAKDTDVFWGVAVDNMRLFQQLYDQIRAYLHELFLTDASSQERSHHERQVSFYQQRADNFWKSYATSYQRKLMLGRKALMLL